MAKKEIHLDDAAQQLFSQIEGIEAHRKGQSAAQMMAASLAEEQKQQDVWRILLCEIVQHIAFYLHPRNANIAENQESQTFEQLVNDLSKLSRKSHGAERILIRYRGRTSESTVSEKLDYEILFGNMLVDLDLLPAMIKRHGQVLSHLMSQLLEAFGVFSDRGINNLSLKIPEPGSKFLEPLRMCLKIVTLMYHAKEGQREIVLDKEPFHIVPLVVDEKGEQNPNLTLLAGVNGVKADAMRNLIARVGDWMQKREESEKGCPFTSIYNAIFGLPKIRSQLVAPFVEINNLDWLIKENSEKHFTGEKAKVARIIASIKGSPEKVAKVIKSVYGDDYPKINVNHLKERLGLSSDLLETIESKAKSEDARQEVLKSVQKRLDTVRDEVFDNLYLTRSKEEEAKGKKNFFGVLHRRLFKMASFFKGRSATRKKMTAMVHGAISFEQKDYEILALDFGIDLDEARRLVEILNQCFDEKGRFLKSVFSQHMSLFTRYEKKIFEFLWRHLKDVVSSEDRTAFLNSLQVLTVQMNQPKRAFEILVGDFLYNPADIRFSDAKALMLANLILHEYDKSLTDIEITPEDILFSRHGLDKEVAGSATWLMDREQDAFFEKVRVIHEALCEALDLGMTRKHRLSAKDLLALERELYIFLSMAETTVGLAIMRSAVNEYGSPESDIYFLNESQRFMSQLIQNLRIAVRGLANIGKMENIPALEAVKNREEVFARLKKTKAHQDQCGLISEWVDEAVKIIKLRS